MTIHLRDNQGREWTVEGDWYAETVGADFDGRGQILAWLRPASPDAGLEPVEPDFAEEVIAELRAGPPPALPAGD